MGFKKKLYELAPKKEEKQVEVKIQQTKRKKRVIKVTTSSNGRSVRESLSSMVSGSHMGLWLLIPEHLRLGTWDLLQGTFDNDTNRLSSSRAMQMVSESALCVNRVRIRGSLCNQGFSLVNGLSFLATDESIHQLLDNHSMQEYGHLQEALLKLRMIRGHYQKKQPILAIDPHRIISTSRRIMPKKKKRPTESSQKMLQTFFCADATTGQPLGFTLASSGKTCSKATLDLLHLIENAGVTDGLVLADKEHFTQDISAYFHRHSSLDLLMPVPNTNSTTRSFDTIDYQPLWAGYAIGETQFSYQKPTLSYRLIIQREGETPENFTYKAFITTSKQNAQELLSQTYSKRWGIEEFFDFEGDMGWNRASTFNLNIRYGKQSLALLAQAATHQLKSKLPKPYNQWSAATLADKVLTNMEGDIRVKDDHIIIAYYKDHEKLNLKNEYANIEQRLINEGVCPKIPWLFDYKLQFRFK